MPQPKPPATAAVDPREWLPHALLPVKLLAMLLFVVAAALATWFGMRLMQARATQNWKTADATIVKSAVVPPGRGGGLARVEVSYRYRLYDVDYTGTRLGYSDNGERAQGEAEALADALKPNKMVPVFYDPLAPASSVLFPGARTSDYTAFWMPAVLLAIGAVLLYIRARVRRWLSDHPIEPEPPKKPAAKW